MHLRVLSRAQASCQSTLLMTDSSGKQKAEYRYWRRSPSFCLSFLFLVSLVGAMYVSFTSSPLLYHPSPQNDEKRTPFSLLLDPWTRTAKTPPTHPVSAQEQNERPLQLFEDVVIGEFLNRGSINIVCFVELPEWWHTLHSVPKSEKMLLKLAGNHTYASKEIDALERLNEDKEKAKRLKILPLVAASRNISNPFLCQDAGPVNCSAEPESFPDSFPSKAKTRLREAKYLAVSIVPFRKGKGFVYDALHSLDEVRIFMRSLLGQLAHAHSVGINNLDLSGDRNIFVDHDGSAILFDWNGAIALGEKSYNPEHAFSILPPEAWLEQVDGHELKMTSISGFDVWSAGIIFARLIYSPCLWTYSRSSRHPVDRLREIILAVGGNTVIVVDNSGFEVDLAKVAGINETMLEDIEFKPLLGGKECSTTSFPLLDGGTQGDKDQALNFLQSMLQISPLSRPNCDTLLEHPFLQ